MKILFVQDSLGTGGAERSNLNFWYFLRDKGVDIEIMVLEHRKEGVEKEVLDNGFKVTFINSNNILKQLESIASKIESFSPNVVNSVLHRSTFAVRILKLYKTFYHVENLVSSPYDKVRLSDSQINPFGFYFYKYLDRITCKIGTDHFLAITQDVKNHYIDNMNISPSNITVIYRGRSENTFLNKRAKVRGELMAELEIKSPSLVFVHVGRQEFAKGHLVLLKAIKEIDNYLFDNRVNFIFCGRKGNASMEIEDFLRKNPLKTDLKFLGHRSDISRILAASDVFLFPSLYEGLGGALIEAQAAALPVVCSNLPVFKEIILEKENALFCRTGNHLDLSEKLKEMVELGDLREVMARKSLENYRAKFKLDDIHQTMLDFYLNLET